jgi:hypothetical protein
VLGGSAESTERRKIGIADVRFEISESGHTETLRVNRARVRMLAQR